MSSLNRFLAVAMLVAFVIVSPTVMAQKLQDFPDFQKQFEKAYDDSDHTKMQGLVEVNGQHARNLGMAYEFYYCEAAVAKKEADADKLLDMFNQLAIVYKLQHDDRFLVDRKKWVEGLDEAKKQGRIDAYSAWSDGADAYNKALNEGGDVNWKAAATTMAKSYAAARKIDDRHYVAQSGDFLQRAYEKIGDDFARVFYARAASEAARRMRASADYPHLQVVVDEAKENRIVMRPDLIDLALDLEPARKAYEKAYAASLEVNPTAKGAGGNTKRTVPKSVANLKVGTMPSTSEPDEFETPDVTLKSSKAFAFGKVLMPWVNPRIRPDNPAMQPFYSHYSFAKGTKDAEAPFLPGATLSFDGKLLVDIDGNDGKKRGKPVKLKQKLASVSFKVKNEKGVTHRRSFLMATKPNTLNLFGAKFAFKAGPLNLTLVGASTMTGKLRGQSITLIDANANGAFDDPGQDCIMIGKGKSARVDPLSRYIYLSAKDGYYPYRFIVVKTDGSAVRSKPYSGALAPLTTTFKAKSKKVSPKFLIVQGSGENSAFYFDAMKARDKVLWVPPGRYSVFSGYMLNTKTLGPKSKSILIGKGQAASLAINPGVHNVWEFGGSGERGFFMNGVANRGTESSSEVEVDGKKIRVFGNMGEEYFNFFAGRIQPTVMLKKNDGRGSTIAKKEMQLLSNGAKTMADTWYPVLRPIKNVPSGKVVFQLVANHSLLGKMKSDWIAVDD